MTALETISGHPRLYRRGAVYYRPAVPQGIVETYGKRAETFSLRTKDRAEVQIKVRTAMTMCFMGGPPLVYRCRRDTFAAPAFHTRRSR